MRMDEMKIRTSFLKRIISKAISNLIKKKLGREIKVDLKDLRIEVSDTARMSLSIDAEMTKEELDVLLVKTLGL